MPNSRLDILLEMLEKQPEEPFLLYALGLEYEAAGEDNPALDYYSLIIEKHPDYLPVYYQAGMLHAHIGNTEKAIILLEKGMILAKQRKDQKTENELRQAIEDMEDV